MVRTDEEWENQFSELVTDTKELKEAIQNLPQAMAESFANLATTPQTPTDPEVLDTPANDPQPDPEPVNPTDPEPVNPTEPETKTRRPPWARKRT